MIFNERSCKIIVIFMFSVMTFSSLIVHIVIEPDLISKYLTGLVIGWNLTPDYEQISNLWDWWTFNLEPLIVYYFLLTGYFGMVTFGFVFGLLSMLVIYLITKEVGGNPWLAVFLFLIIPEITNFIIIGGVNQPVMFFGLLSYYFFIKKGKFNVALFSLSLTLCVFSKLSGVMILLSFFLCILMKRDYKKLVAVIPPIIVFILWSTRTWILYGNPIYPLGNTFFGLEKIYPLEELSFSNPSRLIHDLMRANVVFFWLIYINIKNFKTNLRRNTLDVLITVFVCIFTNIIGIIFGHFWFSSRYSTIGTPFLIPKGTKKIRKKHLLSLFLIVPLIVSLTYVIRGKATFITLESFPKWDIQRWLRLNMNFYKTNQELCEMFVGDADPLYYSNLGDWTIVKCI
jgi:hypothetical protein